MPTPSSIIQFLYLKHQQSLNNTLKKEEIILFSLILAEESFFKVFELIESALNHGILKIPENIEFNLESGSKKLNSSSEFSSKPIVDKTLKISKVENSSSNPSPPSNDPLPEAATIPSPFKDVPTEQIVSFLFLPVSERLFNIQVLYIQIQDKLFTLSLSLKSTLNIRYFSSLSDCFNVCISVAYYSESVLLGLQQKEFSFSKSNHSLELDLQYTTSNLTNVTVGIASFPIFLKSLDSSSGKIPEEEMDMSPKITSFKVRVFQKIVRIGDSVLSFRGKSFLIQLMTNKIRIICENPSCSLKVQVYFLSSFQNSILFEKEITFTFSSEHQIHSFEDKGLLKKLCDGSKIQVKISSNEYPHSTVSSDILKHFQVAKKDSPVLSQLSEKEHNLSQQDAQPPKAEIHPSSLNSSASFVFKIGSDGSLLPVTPVIFFVQQQKFEFKFNNQKNLLVLSAKIPFENYCCKILIQFVHSGNILNSQQFIKLFSQFSDSYNCNIPKNLKSSMDGLEVNVLVSRLLE